MTTGDEISDPKEIAKNYLENNFWIDLAATIPFDMVVSTILGDSSSE